MPKSPLKDIVIILPGVMGSVLQKDGQDIWAISGKSIWNILKKRSDYFDVLEVRNDDPERDVLDDGIIATRLMPDVHIIPGFVTVDGYSKIVELFHKNFDIIETTIDSPDPGNFIQFPYDWRRDNRASALKLQKLINIKLPLWQKFSDNKDARVILIGHSMGGIIARYYVEVLQGWEKCKTLFTVGTPHRGSVKILNYLSNGYKKLFIDVTEVLRTLTSAYQLLPIYKVLKVGDEFIRVVDSHNIPGIEQNKVKVGLEFHQELIEAVKKNNDIVGYHHDLPPYNRSIS